MGQNKKCRIFVLLLLVDRIKQFVCTIEFTLVNFENCADAAVGKVQKIKPLETTYPARIRPGPALNLIEATIGNQSPDNNPNGPEDLRPDRAGSRYPGTRAA